MKKYSALFWALAFCFVFILSQDYLFTSWGIRTGILGFPNWLGWFIIVHLLFIALFYWFTKKYWKE